MRFDRQGPRTARELPLQRGQVARYRQLFAALFIHQPDAQLEMLGQLLRLPGVLGDVQTCQPLERRPQGLHQRGIRDRQCGQTALRILRDGNQLAAQRLGQTLQQQGQLLAQQTRHEAVDQARRQLAQHADRHLQGHAVIRLAGREVITQGQARTVQIEVIGKRGDPVRVDIGSLQIVHPHV